MRRLASTLAALVVAGTLAVTLPASAFAATGELTINRQHYDNPSGCYTSDRWPLSVRNGTDESALIFDDDKCEGQVAAVLPPGQRGVFEFGRSVYLP
ncbi:hypothetical protein ABT354_12525 [Streptomyces sp. NPDC000594]|uniref:hypothetical protein n=1 Tax=Streptomyces sp. NPDC000594 TaxID=3154261 RepID=UPI003327FB6E